MNRRRHENLPIDAMRVVMDLAATGSVSKTADNMGLTRPVVMQRVAKVQEAVGGLLFHRDAKSYRPTPLGQLTLDHARAMVEANDQLALLSLQSPENRTTRVGLNNIFVNPFFERVAKTDALKHLRIVCETSFVLERMLQDDQLDVAVLCRAEKKDDFVPLAEWDEEFVWCKSRSFVLTPGAPIPVLGFVDCALTNLALRSLEDARRFGELVFRSTDRHALKKAAKAGVGVWPIRPGSLDPALVVSHDDGLPSMPRLTYGIYCKSAFGITGERQRLIDILASLAPERADGEARRKPPP
jgi:DNA-binding transcriptional LysR family regulator